MAGNLDFRLNLLANTSGLQQGMNGAKFAVNALVAAMTAVGVGLSIKGLVDITDSYTNLSARVQQATKDNGDFEGAMAGVHQVALMTNSSLQATGDLFTRLNAVGKEMGMTQQQALDLTKTVTQAIQIGGGSAQASEAAVTQFIQAMQGGVLRGEEFNSIMENGYGLAEALAKGLGVTTGELRKMAENGELSAERVITAVQKQASEVQKTYDQFPTTIGNALQRITTSWEILIGKMDQSNGASATVAQWLVNIADNIAELDVVLEDIGEGFIWVGDQLKKIDPATIEAFKTALLSAYDALKDLASTTGVAFEAAVDVINTALQLLYGFSSGVDDAADKTNGFTKILQVINVVIGALSDGFAAVGIGVNLFVGALYSAASAWAGLVSKLTWGGVKEEAIANMNAMALKAEEFYQKASDGAMSFKSKTIEALDEISKTQDQKNAETLASSKATLDQLLANQLIEVEGKKTSEAEKLAAVQDYAEAAIKANHGVMDGVMQADLMTKGYIVTLSEAGKVSVEAWAKIEDGAEKTAASTDKARKAAASLGLDLDIAVNRISSKFKESELQVLSFASNIEALGLKGKDAGNAIYQAWVKWLETAKSQAEIDYAKAKLKEFGDQGQISTAQVEQGMQAIRQVVMKLPDDLDPVEQAFVRLGIKTKEQLALAAQSALADFNTIQASGQATAWDIEEAYKRAMQAAAASGDQAVISATQAKAASLGLEVQVNETGKATIQSYDDLDRCLNNVGRSFDGIRGYARSAGETMREEAKSAGDAWQEAIEKSRKEFAERGQGEPGRVGASYTSYSRSSVLSELKSMGYSDKEAQKLATSIMSNAFTADASAMQKNYGTGNAHLLNPGFEKNRAQGLTSAFGSEVVQKALNKLADRSGLSSISSSASTPSAPSIANVPSAGNKSSKTVEYKFTSKGEEVSLYGSPDDGDAMEALLSEFEMLKRGS